MTQETNNNEALASKRRKVLASFKSKTRVFDDYSIEVEPQAVGEPSQVEVKKVGRSKRYLTNGKQPLACIELKIPADVPDKAAAFFQELDKLTRDIQVSKPQMPATGQLLKMDNLQVFHDEQTGEVNAWLRLDTRSSIAPYQQLSNLLGIINQCFAINEITSRPQSL